GNHAVVPERIHARPLGEALGRTFLPRDAKADGRTQNANGEISGPGNQPQLDAFFQREFAPGLVSPRQGGSGDAHGLILSGDRMIWSSKTPHANHLQVNVDLRSPDGPIIRSPDMLVSCTK